MKPYSLPRWLRNFAVFLAFFFGGLTLVLIGDHFRRRIVSADLDATVLKGSTSVAGILSQNKPFQHRQKWLISSKKLENPTTFSNEELLEAICDAPNSDVYMQSMDRILRLMAEDDPKRAMQFAIDAGSTSTLLYSVKSRPAILAKLLDQGMRLNFIPKGQITSSPDLLKSLIKRVKNGNIDHYPLAPVILLQASQSGRELDESLSIVTADERSTSDIQRTARFLDNDKELVMAMIERSSTEYDKMTLTNHAISKDFIRPNEHERDQLIASSQTDTDMIGEAATNALIRNGLNAKALEEWIGLLGDPEDQNLAGTTVFNFFAKQGIKEVFDAALSWNDKNRAVQLAAISFRNIRGENTAISEEELTVLNHYSTSDRKSIMEALNLGHMK